VNLVGSVCTATETTEDFVDNCDGDGGFFSLVIADSSGMRSVIVSLLLSLGDESMSSASASWRTWMAP